MEKFRAVAEKMAKNFRGYFFCRTLYSTRLTGRSITAVVAAAATTLTNTAFIIFGFCLTGLFF